ncbi:MAG: indolepyruvate oxidoreductase subunit beta [Firmicutes bacterium]|nr:indolepyruvate oxidoreductase subunit beta [Candidatus Fermentithermobacillaceae bacterium]
MSTVSRAAGDFAGIIDDVTTCTCPVAGSSSVRATGAAVAGAGGAGKIPGVVARLSAAPAGGGRPGAARHETAVLKDFIIAGVGGQGGLLATSVLARVFVKAGFDVKTSEVHGMAQRGGTVISYVRRGQKVYSPLVPKGEADVILGLEILEAYRQLPELKVGGLVLTSDERIKPVSVIMGQAQYPDIRPEWFLSRAGRVLVIPALDKAREAGNVRAANTVCLGALSRFLEIPADVWEETIAETVPPKAVDVNLKAFEIGRSLVVAGS